MMVVLTFKPYPESMYPPNYKHCCLHLPEQGSGCVELLQLGVLIQNRSDNRFKGLLGIGFN